VARILVLDRTPLEAQVCECYAVGKREYDRLLADYRHAEVASSAGPITGFTAFPQPTQPEW